MSTVDDAETLNAIRLALNADGLIIWQLKFESQLSPLSFSWLDSASPLIPPLHHAPHSELLGTFTDGSLPFAAESIQIEGKPVSLALLREPTSSSTIFVEALWFGTREPRCSPQQARGLLGLTLSMTGSHSTASDGARQGQLDDTDLIRLCRVIHQSVDLQETGQLIANEARLLSKADRVVVAVARGTVVRLLASSGTEKIVQRAQESRLLTRLCQTILLIGRPAEWSTSVPEVSEALQEEMAAYTQVSHLRAATMIPLFEEPPIPRDDDPKYDHIPRRDPKPLGVLIFEQYSSAEISEEVNTLREQMSVHVATALANARLHSSLFLRRPLLAAGRAFDWLRGRRLAIAGVLVALLTVFVVCCVFVPWNYKVTCDGVLVTSVRQDVFAPDAGMVDEVFVEHNARVTQGQPLLRLRNDELEAQQVVADSRVSELRKLVRSWAFQINEADRRGERDASIQLQGDLSRTEIELQGAQEALRLINARIENLVIRAPSDGRIATFQLKQEILHRPVARGDRLLQIYPPDGPWVLELNVPEYRSGYVRRVMQNGTTPTVEFILATQVELTHYAHLTESSSLIERSEDDGTVLVVRAPLTSAEQPPKLNYGSECHARVHCGSYSLGWCLFGDVVEFLQRHFWI